jgi:hypothetical protein
MVSGPSAAGKSTFIDQLRAARLDPEIRSLMPSDTGDWPVLDRTLLKQGAPFRSILPQSTILGAIAHYDISYVTRGGDRGFASDPFLAILDHIGSLTLVVVRISSERLLEQLSRRRSQHRQAKGSLAPLWKQIVRDRVQDLRRRARGDARILKADAFRSREWLADCYGAWDRFMLEKRGVIPVISTADVAPSLDVAGRPSFVLCASLPPLLASGRM